MRACLRHANLGHARTQQQIPPAPGVLGEIFSILKYSFASHSFSSCMRTGSLAF